MLTRVQLLLGLLLCCWRLHLILGQDDIVNKRIPENLSPSSLVWTLPAVASNMRYSILEENSFFQVKDNVISTKREIDRESLHRQVQTCQRGQEECYIQFFVQITSTEPAEDTVNVPTDTSLYTVRVHIDDVNDNSPVFKLKTQTLSFQEEAAAGSKVSLLMATDQDSDKFGVKRYYLDTQSQSSQPFPFELEPKSMEAPRTGLYLVQTGPLDRERVSRYSAVLIAEDKGEPPKTAQLKLDIEVTDINDHTPVWVTKNFNLSVAEDTPEDTQVFHFEAHDADDGNNGALMYEMNSSPGDESRRYFSLESNTGILRIRQRLDHEQQRRFEISVVARDSGKHTKSVTATLFITVIDQNDHTPIIKVIPKGREPRLQVRENQPSGQFIATVLVSDNDHGLNGQVTCSIDSALFQLRELMKNSNKGYRLYSNERFDRETHSSYNLNISCHDFGSPQRLHSHTVKRIDITDENDNKPVFERPLFTIHFLENRPPFSIIAKVNASDADSSSNGQLRYWLPDDIASQKIVKIDRESGVLRSLRQFDREQTSSYTFFVYASDLGTPSHTATSTVSLIITDENDHTPEWRNIPLMSVTENVRERTPVGTVKAFDEDLGDNGIVVYSIEPASNEFGIDKTTGLIFTRSRNLDRERKASYELRVVARDQGSPRSLSATTLVQVNLLDENDCAPVFVLPRLHEPVNLSCHEQVNHIITRIKANDSDSGDNGQVEYELPERDNPSSRSYFEVDSTSGDLLLVRKLDCSQIGLSGRTRKLMVRARDRGNPPKQTLYAINILINRKSPLPEQTTDEHAADGNAAGYEDPNFTAIIGLIVATVVLVCILLGTIFVLRSKTFVYRKGNRRTGLRAGQDLSRENGPPCGDDTISISAPGNKSLASDNLLSAKALAEETAANHEAFPPHYYYTCETDCYEVNTQRKRGAVNSRIANQEKEQLMLKDLGEGAGATQNSHHNYQVIHFSPELPNAYVDCRGIQESMEPLNFSQNPSDGSSCQDESFIRTIPGSLTATCSSSMDGLGLTITGTAVLPRGTLPTRPRLKNGIPNVNTTSTPILDAFNKADSGTVLSNSSNTIKGPYCTVSFV